MPDSLITPAKGPTWVQSDNGPVDFSRAGIPEPPCVGIVGNMMVRPAPDGTARGRPDRVAAFREHLRGCPASRTLLYGGATEDRVPICPSCRKRKNMRAAFARAQEMLDAAEQAGVELWPLELRRRRMEEDMAAYDAHVRTFGEGTTRARQLRTSIGTSVDVLAKAFKNMLALLEQAKTQT